MKKVFTILIACLAIVGLTAKAALPFTPSTNTGDGAIWYIIEWWCDEDGGKLLPIGLNDDGGLGTVWGGQNADDAKQLFCFIGDETNGFEIYNKAALSGATLDGATLTEDLKLQNFGSMNPDNVWSNPDVGYTISPKVANPFTKWMVAKGTGSEVRHNGYKLYSSEDTSNEPACFRRSGGNHAILINADWEDHYTQYFTRVTEGGGDEGGNNDGSPANSDGFPFRLSGNTTDQAAWYYITWHDNGNSDYGTWEVHGSYTDDKDILYVAWNEPIYSDNALFCFIGDATNGISIYNKVYGDVKLQKLTNDNWVPDGGFSADESFNGMIDKWFLNDDERPGKYMIYNDEYAWRKSGGSELEISTVVSWGTDVRTQDFIWVEGAGLPEGVVEPTDPDAPANSESFPFRLSGNTTDQAAWYHIRRHFEEGGNETWAWWKTPEDFTGDDAQVEIGWGETPTMNDNDLFCFIGNAIDGVSIYNKAYLAGKLGLTEDLILQNFSFGDWPAAGFTKNSAVSGDELFNKWLFEEGTGKYGTTEYCIYVPGTDRSWNRTGGSQLEIGLNVKTWEEDAFRDTFKWVEGAGEVTSNTSNREITSDFKYHVSNRSIVLENVEGRVALISILGTTQQVIAATGGTTTIPVSTPGIYILSANGKSYKVLVK